ncbi:thiamine pyrophosphate-binding protein [Actinophytocola sp.]|uniref:thiamine pyrophosphate-binding protein n=1 Tax=Actinophytocola sp. TaxID=1872138 RepID=UPI002ED8DB26
MNGAELVVATLAREGVRQVYGIPGTTIMDVLDALARQDRIRYLSVRHEQVAASMADGFSRGGGELGVCVASRGPGATNLATAIGTANDESVPLLAIVGQVAHDIAGRAAFEELDVVSLFRPITKWVVEIPCVDRIPELLQRAVRLALSGRPGPVVVSLPLNVLRATASATPGPRFRVRRPRPAADQVRAAARMLDTARRPAVLLGGGACSFDKAVLALAERLGAPVLTTWSRKDRFPNDHPLVLGALGPGAFESTETAVREADVLLALGCRFSEFTTKRWTLLSAGTALIHADIDPGELGKVYPPAVALHADAGETAADLGAALGNQPDRSGWLHRLRVSYVEERKLLPADTPAGVSSARLTAGLRAVLGRVPAVLVVDAPSTGVWIQRYVDFTRPGGYVASAGGAMAWGLPAALGIQLARPAERVLCLSGDGSFWMVAQDLETAVRERVPVVTVVANNFAYGNTRDRQRTAHGQRYFGVFYDNPDLAEFARLLGAHGERVTRPDELEPALERALAAGLPAVVDVVQDRHEGLPPGLSPLPAR